MNIGEWEATPNLNKIYRDVQSLGLERNIAELEAYGFTTVEPEKVGPESFIDELQDALYDVVRRREGEAPDVAMKNKESIGKLIYHIMWGSPAFEKALLNPAGLTLITYLLGENCIVQSVTGQVKSNTAERTLLHSDNGMIPSPFPPYAQVANCTWVLSDYTKENGCLLVVPGSHHFGRHPTPEEVLDESKMVPVEVPRGSLIVWHGNLWHGAFPKQTMNTLRLNIITLWARMYLTPQEPLRYEVTPEILARNPPRFAKIMGQHIAYGWTDQGPAWNDERRKYLGLERTPEERLFD